MSPNSALLSPFRLEPRSDRALPLARNRLLAVVPPDEQAHLLPHLEEVTLESGRVLAEPNQTLSHAYFPDSCVISYVRRMKDGATAEVATVGDEGVVGLNLYFGARSSLSLTAVQVPGAARRIRASTFVELASELPGLERELRHFAHGHSTWLGQTAACNRLHPLDQRCARWLLQTHDRVAGADTFSLTHEFLANMLGVRRAGVTEAAGALQRSGLIAYARGRMRILDRVGLEAAACECYADVRDHLRAVRTPDRTAGVA
jgi:CRP-like cAMP-binding protein